MKTISVIVMFLFCFAIVYASDVFAKKENERPKQIKENYKDTPYLNGGLFEKSDLVIAKGTGNYEALEDQGHGKATLYMLKVKCHPIASKTESEIVKKRDSAVSFFTCSSSIETSAE